MFKCLFVVSSFVVAAFAQCPIDPTTGANALACDTTNLLSCITDNYNCVADTTSTAATAGCCVPITTTTLTTTASTATVTTTASCVDLLNPLTGVSDCPSRSALCLDSTYNTVMSVQCRRTCGYCGNTTTTNTTCTDLTNPSTGVSDCFARRALCNTTIYAPLMAIQCRATCGYCTSG